MPRIKASEITEHDSLIKMMAIYFKQLGYTNIKADIPGWIKPSYVYWKDRPNDWFYPDITCIDQNGIFIILEAETCNTFADQHTRNQFEIFAAHAKNRGGRFEVVVPRVCNERDSRNLISYYAQNWQVKIDNIWTPAR